MHTYIYIMEYYSTIKKNEIMPFAVTKMDLEIVILSELSQIKTNIMRYHLHVGSKNMVQMNLFTKQKYSHKCRKQTQLSGRSRAGINWETGIDIYILLYMKQITYKDLLYLYYSIQHREFYSILCNDLYGERI